MWPAIAATLAAAGLAVWLHTGRYRRATDQPRLALRWWWCTPAVTAAAALVLDGTGSRTSWTDLAYLVGGAAIGLVDIDVHRLPDRFLATWGTCTAGVLAGELLLSGAPATGLLRGAAGAAALGLLYLLFAGVATMGLGDVKLAVLTGAVLGVHSWQSIYVGTVAAFAAAGGVAVLLLLTRRGQRHDHLAFGPAIIVGAVAAIALGGSP